MTLAAEWDVKTPTLTLKEIIWYKFEPQARLQEYIFGIGLVNFEKTKVKYALLRDDFSLAEGSSFFAVRESFQFR